ncbi:MAG: flagellar motor protein MotB [Desulfovibrio sp.]
MAEDEDIEIIQVKIQGEPQIEEGLPLWMATFADMVTLLLCFFVLMLSFTTQEINNFKKLKGALKEAFGVQSQDSEAKETPYAEIRFKHLDSPETKNEIKEVALALRKFVADTSLSKSATVSQDNSGVVFRVQNRALFESGSYKLLPDALPIFKEVIKLLKNTKLRLVIQGHADSAAVGRSGNISNWELSSLRAAVCLRQVLALSGANPDRLKAVGFGDSFPLLPNTTKANRAVNRRVDFYFQSPETPWW